MLNYMQSYISNEHTRYCLLNSYPPLALYNALEYLNLLGIESTSGNNYRLIWPRLTSLTRYGYTNMPQVTNSHKAHRLSLLYESATLTISNISVLLFEGLGHTTFGLRLTNMVPEQNSLLICGSHWHLLHIQRIFGLAETSTRYGGSNMVSHSA